MARQLSTGRKHSTGTKVTTKTPYGTTSDMVVTDENILSSLEMLEGTVLAKDDIGYYFTFSNRVDSNLADPLRYDVNRYETSDRIEEALSNPKQPECQEA